MRTTINLVRFVWRRHGRRGLEADDQAGLTPLNGYEEAAMTPTSKMIHAHTPECAKRALNGFVDRSVELWLTGPGMVPS